MISASELHRSPALRHSNQLASLDCLRGFAALYIFLHHYVRQALREYPDLISVFRLGQAAVMIFFILSGFVIHYSTRPGVHGFAFGTYLLKRVRRIYPPYLIAIGVTWLAALVSGSASRAGSDWQLVGNLFMLQGEGGPGTWFEPYLGNYPLWSLSYEFWFYMFYGGICCVPAKFGKRRLLAVGLTLLGTLIDVVHPNEFARFASCFALWWTGVELAELYRTKQPVSLRTLLPALLPLVLPTGIRTIDFVLSDSQFSLYGSREIVVRRFVTVLVIVAVGLLWQSFRFRGFSHIFGLFRALAPISYGLYVLHVPIIRIGLRLSPISSGFWNLLWIGPVVLLVAWIVEGPIQKAICRFFPLASTLPTPR